MKGGILRFIRYQAPALAWACVIFIASSIPSTRLPRFIHMINDKVIHAAVFFILGLLVYRALEFRAKPAMFVWGRALIAVLIVSVYGLSDEFHQRYVPGRTVDVLDFTADTIGGVLSAAVLYAGYRIVKGKGGGTSA